MKGTILISTIMILLFVIGCTTQTYVAPKLQSPVQQKSVEQGRAVFAITDAAANMGSVTSVKVTVDSVKVQSAAKGWVTVTSTPKTYDLLKLKAEAKQELMADTKLEEGTYNQIRLEVSKIVITDSSGEHEAKLPSGELKITGNLEVKANSTATATFDFKADKSLHVTGNGEYIMAPVIDVETKADANAEVKSDNRVEITGGKTKTHVEIGMDIEGNAVTGIGIPADAELEIEGGKLKVGTAVILGAMASGKGRAVFGVTDAASNMGNVTGLKVTIGKVMIHSNAKGWIDVSTKSKTVDLLDLKAKSAVEFLGSIDLDPDAYDQIRLDVSNVVVTDSSGDHEAKLPSGEIKIIGLFTIRANSTTAETFDFAADQSLHVTGNGEYIMAPVINLQTRENANVELKSGNKAEIKGGILKSELKVGMDANGNVGIGNKIPSDADVSIEGGKIKIKSKIVISYS